MSTTRDPASDSSPPRESHHAARILINKYQGRLEYLLVNKGFAIKWLREVCDIENLEFMTVMDSTPARDVAPFPLSQRETPPSPPSSRHPSSPPTIPSSLASNQPSSTTYSGKIVAITNDDEELLKAKSAINSCNLIRRDTVSNRLDLTIERLPKPVPVLYYGKLQKSDERVWLRWAWSKEDMELGRILQNPFYLVRELPKIEVLLGDSEPQESLWENDAGLSRPSSRNAARFLD
jgi:hypothetical protein